MAKKLSKDDIDSIRKLNNEDLVRLLAYFSDYKHIIDTQSASELFTNKGLDNPDTVKLHSDYRLIKTEVKNRLKDSVDVKKIDDFECLSNQIVVNTALRSNVKGISDDNKTEAEVEKIKNDLLLFKDILINTLK